MEQEFLKSKSQVPMCFIPEKHFHFSMEQADREKVITCCDFVTMVFRSNA